MRDWLEVDVRGWLQCLHFDPHVSMAWQSEESFLGRGQVDTLGPIGRLGPWFPFKPELQPLACRLLLTEGEPLLQPGKGWWSHVQLPL